MFTYCFNNPSNHFDASGNDAIWIQEGNSAGHQGHTGLMVQDEDGNWFYFFWGPSSEDEEAADIISLCKGVKNGAYYVPYGGDASQKNLYNTATIIEMVHEMSQASNLVDRSNLITSTIYLEGDYAQTHEYLDTLCGQNANCTQPYNLLLNNCVQKSLYALSVSDDRFSPYHTIQSADGFTLSLPALHPNYEYKTMPSRLMR